tara:strand:+ start:2531 stop:4129 length:1599 start_codon:yes stop_codon:yes gene_type:complete
MADGNYMAYGAYEFDPIPMIDISSEIVRTSRRRLSNGRRVTLDGLIFPGSGVSSGARDVFSQRALLEGQLGKDYCPFGLMLCNEIFITGHPLVESFTFGESSDNNVQTMPFTVELFFPMGFLTEQDLESEAITGAGASQLAELSHTVSQTKNTDAWSYCGFYEPASYTVSETISARGMDYGLGVNRCMDYATASGISGEPSAESTGDASAIDRAVNYITSALAQTPAMGVGLLSEGTYFLQGTNITVDQEQGNVSVDREFIVFEGEKNIPASLTISAEANGGIDDGNIGVTVNGEVRGISALPLASGVNPGGNYDASSLKFESAKQLFLTELMMGGGAVAGPIYDIANCVYEDGNNQCSSGIYPANIKETVLTPSRGNFPGLHQQPITTSYSYNIAEGTINFSISYNDRPVGVATGTDILSESISISRNNPVDVYAELQILGRASGPILQDIGTQTAYSADLSIEAVIRPPDTASPGWFGGAPIASYDTLITNTQDDIAANNSTFRTADAESFDPKTGRYTRSVSWIYTPCP